MRWTVGRLRKKCPPWEFPVGLSGIEPMVSD